MADDPESNRRVVVRTFAGIQSAPHRVALVDVLRAFCEVPLDHPSLARPLTCGIEGDLPYLVHAYLDGVPADDFLSRNGPQPLEDLAPRITQVAAAIDFAAVAGVHHGALSLRDIIVDADATGVSGFGLLQALQDAGIDTRGAEPSLAGDVLVLASLTVRLLNTADAARIRQLVDHPPANALAFAAGLHDAVNLTKTQGRERAASSSSPVGDIAYAPLRVPDLAPVHAELPLQDRFRAVDDVRADTPRTGRLLDHTVDVEVRSAERRRMQWMPLAVAASLAVGVLVGFASGFAVGSRDAAPQPIVVPRAEATAGQIFTDEGIRGQVQAPGPDAGAERQEPRGRVERGNSGNRGGSAAAAPSRAVTAAPSAPNRPATPSPAVTNRPAPETAAPPARPATTTQPAPNRGGNASPAPGREAADRAPAPVRETPERARSETRSARNETIVPSPRPAAPAPAEAASLFVDSRPTGANIYVDGALVGRTPTLVSDVRPGGHRVRLEKPGYRGWTTVVDATAGARTRVGASLEEQ